MGNKALTAELRTLNNNVAAMGTNIAAMNASINTMEATLNTLTNELLAPVGDRAASTLTVQIYDQVSSQIVSGHGLVWFTTGTLPDDNGNDVFKSRYFLVSAAHVLIDLARTTNKLLKLKWAQSDIEILGLPGNLFIPKSYVTLGVPDIGCIEMQFDDTAIAQLIHETVSWSPTNAVGSIVVGRGVVFLRGPIIYNSQESNRIMVHTPSARGYSSGCPLFNKRGELVAMVHGESMHRGNKCTLSHGKFNDAYSSIVYADAVLRDLLLLAVPVDAYKVLGNAECIPLAIATQDSSWTLMQCVNLGLDKRRQVVEVEQLTDKIGGLTAVCEYLEIIDMRNMTLHTILEELALKIWPHDTEAEELVLKLSEMVVAVAK